MKKVFVLVLLALAGCQSAPKVTLRFFEQTSSLLPDSHVRTVVVPRVQMRIPVSPFAVLSERDVASAELIETAGGKVVALRFDPHGTVALDAVTTRNRGNYLVVFVNERPVAAWLVDRRLSTGQYTLEGDLSDDEARQLVDGLNLLANKRK